jgi:hypothetical protein
MKIEPELGGKMKEIKKLQSIPTTTVQYAQEKETEFEQEFCKHYENMVVSPLLPYGGWLNPGKGGICLLPIAYELEEM